MKGRNKFTLHEINDIERLIKEKLQAPSKKQKGIRARIRGLDFYWEDFHPKSETSKVIYNIENFRQLISSNNIEVINTCNIISKDAKKSNIINQANNQNEHIKNGLAPWVGELPKLLILGTMPGDESICKRMYYANTSRNSFWNIMYSLFPKKENQNNKDFITSHGIALWDCASSGARTGSTDSGFDDKTIIPNDLKSFLNQHPTIKTIILNGKGKTLDYFKRFFFDVNSCNVIILSSTSNTHSKPFEKKEEEWSKIKELINEQ